MGLIKKLDKSVYNRISAGEVVENPASIVKELVENSLDAGATNISIYIEHGGIKSVTVIDNGHGIEEDDLYMAIQPHATSKIFEAEDLESISTLGFRGEALASIVEVAEVEIRSRFYKSDEAKYITVKGGEVVDKGDCALSVGTSINVSSLFYNTPARFKFLKTPKGEEANVTRLINDFMLSNPHISFEYSVDGELKSQNEGTGLLDTVYSVFGDDVAENLISVSFEEKHHKITGYIARPATNAVVGNKKKQTFIVNGRIFEDDTLSSVIQNAYGERLMKRTFPIAVIDIVMPFELVDVNVHPNKREVRFAERKLLNGLVYTAVKNAIEKDEEMIHKNLLEEMNLSESQKESIEETKDIVQAAIEEKKREEERKAAIPLKRGGEDRLTLEEFNEIVNIFKPKEPTGSEVGQFPQIKKKEFNYDDYLYGRMTPEGQAQLEVNPYAGDLEVGDKFTPAYRDDDEEEFDPEAERAGLLTPTSEDEYDPSRPRFSVCGQIFNTYLIAERGDSLFLIDQHATHERILYDNFIADLNDSLEIQDLLLPYEVQIGEDEREALTKFSDRLRWLGFKNKVFDGRIEVYSVPCLLVKIDIDDFIHSIAANICDLTLLGDLKPVKEKFATLACKSAIKGGERLDEDQIDYVMNYFLDNNIPLQCPHGRPTVVKIDKKTIEKLFKRIV